MFGLLYEVINEQNDTVDNNITLGAGFEKFNSTFQIEMKNNEMNYNIFDSESVLDFETNAIKILKGNKNTGTTKNTKDEEFENWYMTELSMIKNILKNASDYTYQNSIEKESYYSYEIDLINNIFSNISTAENLEFTKRQEWVEFEKFIKDQFFSKKFNSSNFDTNSDGVLDKKEQQSFTTSFVKNLSHAITEVLTRAEVQTLLNKENESISIFGKNNSTLIKIPVQLSYLQKNISEYFTKSYYNELNRCGNTYSCLSCVETNKNIKYDLNNKVSESGKICEECIPPYFLDLTSGYPQCLPCQDINCEKCSPRTGICDKCQNGTTNFALDKNYKYKDILYAMSYKYHCRNCNTIKPNCKECEMVKCLLCEDGFNLKEGKCIKAISKAAILILFLIVLLLVTIGVLVFVYRKKTIDKKQIKTNIGNINFTDGKNPQIVNQEDYTSSDRKDNHSISIKV